MHLHRYLGSSREECDVPQSRASAWKVAMVKPVRMSEKGTLAKKKGHTTAGIYNMLHPPYYYAASKVLTVRTPSERIRRMVCFHFPVVVCGSRYC